MDRAQRYGQDLTMPAANIDVLTDQEIQVELDRYRARNTAAEIATQNVAARTRRENLQCRERMKKVHEERMRREYANSQAHLKAFKGMYDNSPYRHDVVKMRTRQRQKRNAEESHQAQIDKTLATLAAMTGTDEEFVGRKVTEAVRKKVIHTDAITELVYEQRKVEVDAIATRAESEYVKKMVQEDLENTRRLFKVCRDLP